MRAASFVQEWLRYYDDPEIDRRNVKEADGDPMNIHMAIPIGECKLKDASEFWTKQLSMKGKALKGLKDDEVSCSIDRGISLAAFYMSLFRSARQYSTHAWRVASVAPWHQMLVRNRVREGQAC
jgi:hypothetical protein